MLARCLAGRVIELMRATGMPNGLSALGFTEADLDALATGAEPQYRVIKNGPVDVGREEIRGLYRGAMRLLVTLPAIMAAILLQQALGLDGSG